MAKGLKLVRNSLADYHKQITNAANKVQGALARDIYKQYQNAQVRRFESKGQSEGTPWKPLNPKYAAYKRRFCAAKGYPEGGRRVLVFTGTLLPAVVGLRRESKQPENDQSATHSAIFEPRRLVVAVGGDYAKWVDAERPFMKFGAEFWRKAHNRVKEYFKRAEL